MATTNRLATLAPQNAELPGTTYAQIFWRVGGSTPAESAMLLAYDASATEYADWKVRMPAHYAGGGLTLIIEWMAASATANDVVWEAAIRRIENDAEDIDGSHTYDFNTATATTTASATGETVNTTITFTSGADMDSWAAGETAIVRIRRKHDNAGDTMAGDAQLVNAVINET